MFEAVAPPAVRYGREVKVGQLVSRCFKPSHPQGITSGLKRGEGGRPVVDEWSVPRAMTPFVGV